MDKQTKAVVDHIKESLSGAAVFDDLVQMVIDDHPNLKAVQQVWLQGLEAVSTDDMQTESGRNELYQQIDDLYSIAWREAGQVAMEHVIARLMVEVYDAEDSAGSTRAMRSV